MTVDAVEIGLLTADDIDDARDIALLAEVAVGTRDAWLGHLRSPSHVLLAARTAGRLVGVAVGAVAVDDADVEMVAVAPDQRRRGIARALTEALCTALFAHGVERVLLEVRAANAPAVQLYVSLGFREVARRTSYYGPGEDALVLARRAPSVEVGGAGPVPAPTVP